MFYSYSLISFIIIAPHLIIPISNASPSFDDKMLIAFMKGQQQIKIGQYSKRKYEAYLGIVYFMRKNWQCDKIHEKFEEYERTECQKYRKYLDIFCEYLFREYAGNPTVKPKFAFKGNEIKIEGPIIYAVKCLSKISQFYFNSEKRFNYGYEIKRLFNEIENFQPKLMNEKRLNHLIKLENEPKLTINETILDFAIDTANEWQTNESAERIIRQNFEKNLEEMFKKTLKNAKEDEPENAGEINDDKHKLIVNSIFDDSDTWLYDAFVTKLVKGNVTNIIELRKLVKEYHLNEYEDIISIAYFMRKNWQCANNKKEIKKKCQKYRKYLHLLYEYLFRLYLEGKDADLANKLPAVKPIFIDGYRRYHIRLDEVIRILIAKWKCFWNKNESEWCKCFHMYLVNEEELNHEIKDENQNWTSKIIQKAMKKIKGLKQIKKIRIEFDQKMNELAKESAKEYDNKKQCQEES